MDYPKDSLETAKMAPGLSSRQLIGENREMLQMVGNSQQSLEQISRWRL